MGWIEGDDSVDGPTNDSSMQRAMPMVPNVQLTIDGTQNDVKGPFQLMWNNVPDDRITIEHGVGTSESTSLHESASPSSPSPSSCDNCTCYYEFLDDDGPWILLNDDDDDVDAINHHDRTIPSSSSCPKTIELEEEASDKIGSMLAPSSTEQQLDHQQHDNNSNSKNHITVASHAYDGLMMLWGWSKDHVPVVGHVIQLSELVTNTILKVSGIASWNKRAPDQEVVQ